MKRCDEPTGEISLRRGGNNEVVGDKILHKSPKFSPEAACLVIPEAVLDRKVLGSRDQKRQENTFPALQGKVFRHSFGQS